MSFVRLNVNMPAELHRKAKIAAALNHETLSDVVRTAIEEYVGNVLEPEYKAMLDLRSEEMDKDPTKAIPWEEVKAKLSDG